MQITSSGLQIQSSIPVYDEGTTNIALKDFQMCSIKYSNLKADTTFAGTVLYIPSRGVSYSNLNNAASRDVIGSTVPSFSGSTTYVSYVNVIRIY